MSGVRVLVGTRKGAFVLTSDAKRQQWDVSGPHFGGWEIYHMKGSPADPNRLYASQSTGWFGQLIQRSNDGGKTWEAGRQQVRLRRRDGHAPVVRRHAASVGVQARVAPRAVADRSRHGLRRRRRRGAVPHDRRRADVARTAGPADARHGLVVGAGRRRVVPAHHRAGSHQCRSDLRRHLGRRRVSHRRRRHHVAAHQPGAAIRGHPEPDGRGRPLRPPDCQAPGAARTCCSCRSTGTSCAATTAATRGARSAGTCPPTSASSSTCTRTSRRPSTSCRSRATRSTIRRTASCACIAAGPAARIGRRSPGACRSATAT